MRRARSIDVLTALAVVLAAPAALAQTASPPRLSFPADCMLGENCFIQSYVDHDTGPGARDFTCGPRTYDKHDGTDVALPDRSAMAGGVAVLAAAAGRVRNVRDNMADISIHDAGAPDIKGRECGNGVVIAHGDGWETQYCHMRNGSIAVKPGQDVEMGQRLGLIGLSGEAEFPHLHFRVSRQDMVVDPFDAHVQMQSCNRDASGAGLWGSMIAYAAGGVVASGFAGEEPQLAKIASGAYGSAALSSMSLLAFWVEAYGVNEGDIHRLTVRAPDGTAIMDETLPPSSRTQARQQRWIVRRPPQSGWPAGVYRGEYQLVRDGRVIAQATRAAAIP